MIETEISLNGALDLAVRRSPEKPFIIHRQLKYTYSQTDDQVTNLSSYFSASGVKCGDKICLLLPRIPELIIAFLAATKIGAVPAPVNFLVQPEEIGEFVARVGPKVIIAHQKLLTAEIATPNSNLNIIVGPDEKRGWRRWDTIVNVNRDSALNVLPATPDNLAYLNFTTGSSGYPKGALATHANIYWNTRSAVEAFNITETDIHLCMFASFAHPHELFARPLYTGGTLVLLEEINPKTIAATIDRHKVTCMMGLAPMYEMMATYSSSDQLASLRIVESGGMYTSPEISAKFWHRFSLPILSVWGSTETSGIALANTPSAYKSDGSMGKVCPHYQVKIVDEHGSKVNMGEMGELFFKGSGVVANYEESNAVFESHQGWYCSGDIARQDEEGFFYFIERKSGMIKVAGLKVYPLQVEIFLMEHPQIEEVAVLGLENRRKGVVPMAFIVSKDGQNLSDDNIFSFCKGKLPPYMIPKHIQMMDVLPKIGSGKVNKKALQEYLA